MNDQLIRVNQDRLWDTLMAARIMTSSVAGELVRTGFGGPEHERRPIPFTYIECHIEQGPILAAADVDVGIVTGVQSISWQRLELHGAAGHAPFTASSSRRCCKWPFLNDNVGTILLIGQQRRDDIAVADGAFTASSSRRCCSG